MTEERERERSCSLDRDRSRVGGDRWLASRVTWNCSNYACKFIFASYSL